MPSLIIALALLASLILGTLNLTTMGRSSLSSVRQ